MDFDRRTLVNTTSETRPWALTATARAAWFGAAVVAALSVLTAVGAHVRVPLEPVPITLQTLFVLLAGALAGPARGMISQSVYVFGGVLGVPLFAGSMTGLAVLAGPTGGYLLGFIVAPLLIGRMINRRTGFRWTLFVFSLGSFTILSLGVLHLVLFTAGDLPAALRMGVLPFVVGDAAKTLAAASIYGSYRRFRSCRAAG